MNMLRVQGLYDNAVCGQKLGCLRDIVCTSATWIRQCVDRGFIVREKWRASPRQHDDFHAYE